MVWCGVEDDLWCNQAALTLSQIGLLFNNDCGCKKTISYENRICSYMLRMTMLYSSSLSKKKGFVLSLGRVA